MFEVCHNIEQSSSTTKTPKLIHHSKRLTTTITHDPSTTITHDPNPN